MILGTGTLPDSEPGVRRGNATFPVRGQKPVCLDLLARGSDGWTARLRVGNDTGTVTKTKAGWRGDIDIEGYIMTAVITPDWTITFDG